MKKIFFILIFLFVFIQTSIAEEDIIVDKIIVAEEDIIVDKIIVAQDVIPLGQEQIIEVRVKNLSSSDNIVFVRLKLTLPDGERIFYGKEKVKVFRNTIENVFFTYYVGSINTGRYIVAAYVYDEAGQVLFSTSPLQSVPFITENADRVLLDLSHQSSQEGLDNSDFILSDEKTEFIDNELKKFIPHQIIIEKIKFLVVYALKGSSARVSVKIKNIGGDIVRDIRWRLFYDIRFRLNEIPKNPFFEDVIDIISPGETKLYEVPVFIPENSIKGEYYVFGHIDIGEENNKIEHLTRSVNSLFYQDTILIKPKNKAIVRANDEVEFVWISNKLKRFFVELSIDEKFENKSFFLRLPKNSPTVRSNITLLSGELKIIFKSFINQKKNPKIYWRIIGFDSQKNRIVSNPSEFFIEK